MKSRGLVRRRAVAQGHKKFKILPHTADLRLKVWGKDYEELFQNAVFGMAHIIKPTTNLPSQVFQKKNLGGQDQPPTTHNKLSVKISLTSVNINTLLVDFLSEVLYHSQTDKVVYPKAEFKKFSETSLEAEIFGNKVKKFDEDIKAVTYHEVNITKNPKKGLYKTILVFDI